MSNKNSPAKGLKNMAITMQYIKSRSKMIIGFRETKDKMSNIKAVVMSKSWIFVLFFVAPCSVDIF